MSKTKTTSPAELYIGVENLNIRGLLKNHKLAASISDAGWNRFHLALERKCKMYKRIFVKVPARDTTQTCANCGFVCHGDDKVVLGQSSWTCPCCGSLNLRDPNSARVIRQRALEMVSAGLVTRPD